MDAGFVICAAPANAKRSRSRRGQRTDKAKGQRISLDCRKQKGQRLSDAMMGLATAQIQHTLQVNTNKQ